MGIEPRYNEADLTGFARELLVNSGMGAEQAAATARILVTADMMGHETHGLALLPGYLDALASGGLLGQGEIEVLADRPACATWNANLLPGPWVVEQALALGSQRCRLYGTATIAIRNCGHIGALAAYLPPVTSQGLFALIACSTPSVSAVAPYGGLTPLFTPDPLAAGIPTAGDPIMLDISSSISTINRARQLAAAGAKLGGPWAMDGEGNVTDDPAALLGGGGTLLPVGGLDHGHKGYGLALLVESLTQGLSGYGRKDQPRGQRLSVFVQVIDPAAFGGLEPYRQEMTHIAERARTSKPRPGVSAVRVPGDRAMAGIRAAASRGVPVALPIMTALAPYARGAALRLPHAVEPIRPSS